jgi:hypothetical protein
VLPLLQAVAFGKLIEKFIEALNEIFICGHDRPSRLVRCYFRCAVRGDLPEDYAAISPPATTGSWLNIHQSISVHEGARRGLLEFIYNICH